MCTFSRGREDLRDGRDEVYRKTELAEVFGGGGGGLQGGAFLQEQRRDDDIGPSPTLAGRYTGALHVSQGRPNGSSAQ